MKKYIFHLNYKYSAKFLGIFDYQILLPLSIYAAILVILLYFLNLDFFVSFGTFIFFFLPPLLIFSIGINRQPTLSYFKALFRYAKNSKLYLFKNDCQNSQKKV